MKLRYFIFVLQLLVIYTIKLDSLLSVLLDLKFKFLVCPVYLLGFITVMVIEKKYLHVQNSMIVIIFISLLGASCYIYSFLLLNEELMRLPLNLTLYTFLIVSKLMMIKVSFEVPQNLKFCGANTYFGVSLLRGTSAIIVYICHFCDEKDYFKLILVFLHTISLLYSYFLCKPKTCVRVAQNYVIG